MDKHIQERMFRTYNDLMELSGYMADPIERGKLQSAAFAISDMLERTGVWAELTR